MQVKLVIAELFLLAFDVVTNACKALYSSVQLILSLLGDGEKLYLSF